MFCQRTGRQLLRFRYDTRQRGRTDQTSIDGKRSSARVVRVGAVAIIRRLVQDHSRRVANCLKIRFPRESSASAQQTAMEVTHRWNAPVARLERGGAGRVGRRADEERIGLPWRSDFLRSLRQSHETSSATPPSGGQQASLRS